MEQDVDLLIRDEQCERALIGTLMQYDCIDEVRQYLTAECFTDAQHRAVFKACLQIADNNHEVNFINAHATLQQSEVNIPVVSLIDYPNHAARSSLEAVRYALRLKDLAARRQVWRIGQELIMNGIKETEDITTVTQKAADMLKNIQVSDDGNLSTLEDAVASLNEQMKRNAQQTGTVTGTDTGFRKLNDKGGLQGSDLIIIAGESSQGKTSLALTVVRKAIEKSKVVFYSMEMTKEQLAARIVSAESGVPANELLYSNQLTEQQWEQYDEAIGHLPLDNLLFDERSTSNLDTIIASIRRLKREKDVSGAIVDYLQILSVNTDLRSASKEQLMAEAARRLKNLAKDLNIWIIALSQLNRDKLNPEPNLNRLRDSGQIVEAADIVMFVYRPEYYGKLFPEPYTSTDPVNKAMIDVAKGRNIGVFKFVVDFNKQSASFTDTPQCGIVIGGDTQSAVKQSELPF